MSDIGDWYRSIPIITRSWFTASVALPLIGVLGLVDFRNFLLFPDLVFNRFQVFFCSISQSAHYLNSAYRGCECFPLALASELARQLPVPDSGPVLTANERARRVNLRFSGYCQSSTEISISVLIVISPAYSSLKISMFGNMTGQK